MRFFANSALVVEFVLVEYFFETDVSSTQILQVLKSMRGPFGLVSLIYILLRKEIILTHCVRRSENQALINHHPL